MAENQITDEGAVLLARGMHTNDSLLVWNLQLNLMADMGPGEMALLEMQVGGSGRCEWMGDVRCVPSVP